MKYNFDDVDFQIELNELRLKRENERYGDYKNKITIITLLYTVYVAYISQLIIFGFTNHYFCTWYYILPFCLFTLFFALSIINTILLLLPKKIAHTDLPSTFYMIVKDMYLNKKVKKDLVKYYIRETYKKQLENAVELNFNLCNKKSKLHYWSYVFALSALLPYMTCIGVKLSVEPENITKVEIINNSKAQQ